MLPAPQQLSGICCSLCVCLLSKIPLPQAGHGLSWYLQIFFVVVPQASAESAGKVQGGVTPAAQQPVAGACVGYRESLGALRFSEVRGVLEAGFLVKLLSESPWHPGEGSAMISAPKAAPSQGRGGAEGPGGAVGFRALHRAHCSSRPALDW